MCRIHLQEFQLQENNSHTHQWEDLYLLMQEEISSVTSIWGRGVLSRNDVLCINLRNGKNDSSRGF